MINGGFCTSHLALTNLSLVVRHARHLLQSCKLSSTSRLAHQPTPVLAATGSGVAVLLHQHLTRSHKRSAEGTAIRMHCLPQLPVPSPAAGHCGTAGLDATRRLTKWRRSMKQVWRQVARAACHLARCNMQCPGAQCKETKPHGIEDSFLHSVSMLRPTVHTRVLPAQLGSTVGTCHVCDPNQTCTWQSFSGRIAWIYIYIYTSMHPPNGSTFMLFEGYFKN